MRLRSRELKERENALVGCREEKWITRLAGKPINYRINEETILCYEIIGDSERKGGQRGERAR